MPTFAKARWPATNNYNTMTMRYLSISLLLLFTGVLSAQQTSPKTHNYLRFEGQAGDQIMITANILQLFGSLSGNYNYHSGSDAPSFSNTFEFQGKLADDGTTDLFEFGKKDASFSGSISNKSFSGKWQNEDGKLLAFDMTETYPEGSMAFDIYYLRSETELAPSENNSPVAEVELVLFYPTDSHIDSAVSQSVKQIIRGHFFGKQYDQTHPDSMMSFYEAEYMSTYLKQNQNWHDGGASFSWEKMNSMQVVFNADYLLCLEYMTYAYTGGAHGMTHTSFDILSLQDGSPLTYEDIFIPESEDSISVLLSDKIRQIKGIPPEVKLSEAGFFVDSIPVNKNIYISNTGLGFLYNNYEIAPYSSGQSRIFLEYDTIQGLLKEDSPVYKLSRR